MTKVVRACLVIIGNEILSGRTQDANLNFLARRLNQRGIRLSEARVIPDTEDIIIRAINEMRATYDYVFTTGGIGPTHDDITVDCIAKAFGVEVIVDPEAKRILETYYHERELEFTEARMRMARIPAGGSLIDNPISKAPGIKIDNVHIMAGVPKIMQAQFDNIVDQLEGGIPVSSKTVSCFLPESIIATGLGDLQKQYPETDLGSYPFYLNQRFGTSLVARGTDMDELEEISLKLKSLVESLNGEWVEGELNAE